MPPLTSAEADGDACLITRLPASGLGVRFLRGAPISGGHSPVAQRREFSVLIELPIWFAEILSKGPVEGVAPRIGRPSTSRHRDAVAKTASPAADGVWRS